MLLGVAGQHELGGEDFGEVGQPSDDRLLLRRCQWAGGQAGADPVSTVSGRDRGGDQAMAALFHGQTVFLDLGADPEKGRLVQVGQQRCVPGGVSLGQRRPTGCGRCAGGG